MLLNLINIKDQILTKFFIRQRCIKSSYQLGIIGRKKVGIKQEKNPKAFIDYSQTIDDAYENVEDYNPTENRKVLIVFVISYSRCGS